MSGFNKFAVFVENLAEKVHNLGADTLRVMLTNVAPVASNTVRANITELANGNGYTTGGATASVASSSQAGGTYRLVLNNPPTWTAAGGAMGPFRYAVLYNDTPTSPADPLIAWYDYGSSITLQVGETFRVDFDASNGVLTLT
jgi:hypothetical protein